MTGTDDGGAIDDVGVIDDAAALGVEVLTQIVEGTADGIFLCDAERRWVYVNPAACRMLGRSASELVGHDYVEVVPARERAAARQYYSALLGGSTEMLTRMLVGAGGEEREMVFAPFRVDVGGRAHGAALFRDFTEARAASRAAGALAQSVAELVGESSVSDMLAGTARHAVEGTRAVWAGLAVVGESGRFGPGGAYGPDGPEVEPGSDAYREVRAAPAERYLAAMTGGTLRVGEAPSRAVTLTRGAWEQDPVLSTYGRTVLEHEWEFAVSVPLAYDNRVIGALMVLLPIGTTALSDAEVAFCTALADHAAVAVTNDRLSRQAARSAELRERGRVARELHDSVSQALFAMTMHARTAQLALARAGSEVPEPLAASLEQLSQLSRGTLAEMRALIFELRPEALADEGLVRALTTQAAAISAREPVMITVEGPTARLPVDADVETELYRVVSESLRHLVKHAGPTTITVGLRVVDDELEVTVVDDGTGVDPTALPLGRPSVTILARQTRTVGAAPTISSRERNTTSIVVPLRTPGRDGEAP